MDRVSEPASPPPKRIESIDRAATRLKAITEALERDGHCPCVGEVEEALLR
jgi:hypothetical protein